MGLKKPLSPVALLVLDQRPPSSCYQPFERGGLGRAGEGGAWFWNEDAIAALENDELLFIARVMKRSTDTAR